VVHHKPVKRTGVGYFVVGEESGQCLAEHQRERRIAAAAVIAKCVRAETMRHAEPGDVLATGDFGHPRASLLKKSSSRVRLNFMGHVDTIARHKNTSGERNSPVECTS
jgi:hypothetical protein